MEGIQTLQYITVNTLPARKEVWDRDLVTAGPGFDSMSPHSTNIARISINTGMWWLWSRNPYFGFPALFGDFLQSEEANLDAKHPICA